MEEKSKMSEHSIEEEIKIRAQQGRKIARYMSSTEQLVEEQIRKARERGDFDNLEGAGKPLDLSENPYEPPELRMVMRILKNNDFTPYWIQLGKDIDADTAKLWKEVENFKKYSLTLVNQKQDGAAVKRYEEKKALFYLEKRREFEKMQKNILNYNLHCPTFRLGRANIEVDEEMGKVMAAIDGAIKAAITGQTS
jgi:DnaJ homolog subfamily C member 28